MPEPIDQPQTPVAKLPYTGKKRGGISKGLTQAYELRDLTHRLAKEIGQMSPKDDDDRATIAREVSSLIRAWSEADDHVRIHRNKPLPGSLRPVAKVKRSVKPRLEPMTIPQGPLAPVIQTPV